MKNRLTALFVRATEWQKGQTMTEYALILSAVAVVVFVGYKAMGSDIQTLIGTVTGDL